MDAFFSRANIAVQGIFPVLEPMGYDRMIVHELAFQPGEEKRLQYLNVIGDDQTDTLDTDKRLQPTLGTSLARMKKCSRLKFGQRLLLEIPSFQETFRSSSLEIRCFGGFMISGEGLNQCSETMKQEALLNCHCECMRQV